MVHGLTYRSDYLPKNIGPNGSVAAAVGVRKKFITCILIKFSEITDDFHFISNNLNGLLKMERL